MFKIIIITLLLASLIYLFLKRRINSRHSCVLHPCVFLAGPSPLQFFPPFEGGGLVQVLVNICVPPPQVTVHFEADQSV